MILCSSSVYVFVCNFNDPRLSLTHNYFFGNNFSRCFLQFILDADKILGQRRSNLPETAQKVLVYANRQKRPSPELKAFLQELQKYSEHLQGEDLIGVCDLIYIINLTKINANDYFTAFQQLTALKLLPYVMQNPSRKLSKSEAASYFFPYFKVCSTYVTEIDVNLIAAFIFTDLAGGRYVQKHVF